ncbi:MAG: Ig-like domain-containing protein [Planctomycetota bacterium]
MQAALKERRAGVVPRMEVRLLAGLLAATVASCGGGGSSPASAIVFQVTAVTPPDETADVPLTAEVNLFFSKPVDRASLDDTTVQVVAESGDAVFGDLSVPQLNPGIVRFQPRFGYFPFAVHRIRVSRGVLDVNGDALDRDYEFVFQTQEEGPVLPDQGDVEKLGDLLQVGRWFHRMTLLPSNRFLVAGGYRFDNIPVDIAENLIPALKTSNSIASAMRRARAAHVQLLLRDGRVLLAGGETSSDPFVPIDDCEIFDPATFQFSDAARMNVARSFADGVVLPDGRALVTGGQSDGASGFHFRADAEIYDPAANTWTLLTSIMSAPRSSHISASIAGGDVLVIGGAPGRPNADFWRDATEEFEEAFPPPSFEHFLGATTILPDGRPFLAGGFRSLGVTIGDPDFGFLNAVNFMPEERAFATATAFPDGRVLLVGGTDFNQLPGLIRDTVDLFFPIGKTGKIFRVAGITLPNPTTHHAAGSAPDGSIWITGGLPPDFQLPGRRQVVVVHPD